MAFQQKHIFTFIRWQQSAKVISLESMGFIITDKGKVTISLFTLFIPKCTFSLALLYITVSRPLVKNLLMGFIHTPPSKRDEAFRVVGHILGFTDDELKEVNHLSTDFNWYLLFSMEINPFIWLIDLFGNWCGFHISSTFRVLLRFFNGDFYVLILFVPFIYFIITDALYKHC